jgi:hypothetical protein
MASPDVAREEIYPSPGRENHGSGACRCEKEPFRQKIITFFKKNYKKLNIT